MQTKNYWNARYASGGNSGYGSYGEQMEKKLSWLVPLKFNSITDIGCGDFNFGKELIIRHPAKYCGYDISEAVVARNSSIYPYSFKVYDKNKDFEVSELTLCLDVLFHIYEDEEYEALLNILKTLPTKYLALTAYEYDRPSDNHVKYRKFDPTGFGKLLKREIIEEDGQLYFYLFEK